MTPDAFLHGIIEPAGRMMPQHDSPEARCLLLAIAGQESEWSHRLQQPVAYARGFWQCEKQGAVLNVVTSDAAIAALKPLCTVLSLPVDLDQVYEAIAWNDTLACWVARLNLLLDPFALPALGDTLGAWETYIRVWRPGKPDESRWLDIYAAAAACFAPSSPVTS